MKSRIREVPLEFWIIGLPILVLFPVILNFVLFQGRLPMAYGEGDTWLGFWGNYSGGVLSAIVAYVVANSQVNKQAKLTEDKEKKDRIIAQLPSLVRIKFELEKYIEQLENVQEQWEFIILAHGGLIETTAEKGYLDYDENAEGILDFELIGKQFKVEHLDKDDYKFIEKIENDGLIIELISCLKFYESFAIAASFNPDIYEEEKDKIKKVEKPDDKTIRKILKRFEEMENESNGYYQKKLRYWKEFLEENMIERFKNLLAQVNDEIDVVKKIKG